MKRATGGFLVAALVLSGCGFRDSAFNPFNWFGRAEPVAVTETGANPLIPAQRTGIFRRRDAVYAGNAIAQVTDLAIERMPGGAIVRATGVSDRNGPYDARLIRRDAEGAGAITYDFEVVTPSRALSTETARVRTVTVGVQLSERELAGVESIRVVGRANALSSGRR